MSQFLDYSAGAHKSEPPPQKAPGRPPRRTPGRSWKDRAPKKQGLVILLAAVLVAAAVVVFILTSSDSGKATAATSARYCDLASQLDQVSSSTGAGSAPGVYDGPPGKIKTAVAEMGATLQELRTVAPGPIRHDVGVVVDAMKRAAAGDTSGVKTPGFAKSRQRISSYRAGHCQSGGGSGEG